MAHSRENAEQRAKAAAEKERRRRERREKREQEAQRKLQLQGQLQLQPGAHRKRDPAIDGPARPIKPSVEEMEACREALDHVFRKKNEHVTIYEPVLMQLMSIQDAVKRDELAWKEKKKKKKAKEIKS